MWHHHQTKAEILKENIEFGEILQYFTHKKVSFLRIKPYIDTFRLFDLLPIEHRNTFWWFDSSPTEK